MDKIVENIGKTVDKIKEVSKSIIKEFDLYHYWLNDPTMFGSNHIPYDGTRYKNWEVEIHIDSITFKHKTDTISCYCYVHNKSHFIEVEHKEIGVIILSHPHGDDLWLNDALYCLDAKTSAHICGNLCNLLRVMESYKDKFESQRGDVIREKVHPIVNFGQPFVK